MKHLGSDNIRLVIAHTLKVLGNYSSAAEDLLIITINLQEKYWAENPEGGLGLYKIDSATHLSIWDDYLAFDPDRASTIRGLASHRRPLGTKHLLEDILCYDARQPQQPRRPSRTKTTV